MKNDNDISDSADQALARRFHQLRASETLQAPEFPAQRKLLERKSTDTVVSGAWLNAVPKFALAASVLIALFLYLNPAAQQNPGDLYADIMGTNIVATDSLLSLSITVAPQSTTVPGLFDFDATFYSTFDTDY